ncbi:MAG: outer membrane protein assembly factor BamC [Betaproteobacteria bacterium]|nr:outer membrane protein assembly factor BamC [Betaproteobacteria bacterium]
MPHSFVLRSRVSRLLAVSACCFLTALGGCSGLFEGKKIDYKSANKLPPLEVPPDLAAPGGDSRYKVPDAVPKDETTYSEYSQRHNAPAAEPARDDVLPASDKVRMERAGLQRWLVVKAPPDQVWFLVKDFWQENGFIIKKEDPEAGYMETDWSENRARIPVGGLTGFLNKALDSVSSLPERDMFRTRLERGTEPGTTEVYISHRGMAEVYVKERDNNTKWQVRPSDPELEAKMLTRLAQRLGVPAPEAKTLVKEADTAPVRASLVKSDKGSVVEMKDSFDRAWRRVGLALDRIGFMVEDRNRADGVYFVQYQDPEAEPPKRTGLARLAFWRSDEKKGPEHYRIKVSGEDGSGSRVSVLDHTGKPDDGDTSRRILAMLVEQLR